MNAARRVFRPFSGRALRVACGFAVALTVSCGKDHAIDYAAYERIPHRPASAAIRAVAMSTPLTKRAIFYGQYGGPGNSGGVPVDEMDDLFRRHDIVYSLARTRKTMVVADHFLVEELQVLDRSEMSAEAISYCERVIRFFRAPISRVLGKPWSTLYTVHEPPECCFQRPGVVRAFFSQEHPGVPRAGESSKRSGRGD